jgi:hypothetical protein
MFRKILITNHVVIARKAVHSSVDYGTLNCRLAAFLAMTGTREV